MKHKLSTILLAALALATAAPAQTKPNVAPDAPVSNGESIQIVFVPTKLFKEAAASGKLKENTFYWSTPTDKPDRTPVAMQEDGKPLMRVGTKFDGETSDVKKSPAEVRAAKGQTHIKTLLATKETTRVKIMRAFNVPEGKKSATISVVTRTTPRTAVDAWSEPINKVASRIIPSLTRDGQSKPAKGVSQLEINSNWKTYDLPVEIVDKTQQVVVQMDVVGLGDLDISSLEVTFSEQALEKAPEAPEQAPAASPPAENPKKQKTK